MKSQEREVNVLLGRLVALEEEDSRQAQSVASLARVSEGKAVVGERIVGLARESGQRVPQSLSGDGESGLWPDAREDRQVVLREAEKSVPRRSWAGIDTLFIL